MRFRQTREFIDSITIVRINGNLVILSYSLMYETRVLSSGGIIVFVCHGGSRLGRYADLFGSA